ncbi:GMC oxidoreductase [Metabacillus sp. Hm71]|uniref:GMC oxidoreductase n=1 Tax=Metabacillus sp. Hm71 TaxID=3450743 RepID=UPI003F42F2F8
MSKFWIPFCPSEFPNDYMEEWIPTVPLHAMEKKEYDVLIIGSGAGGGALLWRLCQQWENKGKRIGMIEAGDALLPTHSANIMTMNSETISRYIVNPKISEKIGERLPQYRGAILIKILGGQTIFWGAVCPRMPVSELKHWPIPLHEMEVYYNIAEEAMNITQNYFQESPFTTILLERLRKNGLPFAIPMPMAMNLQATQFGFLQSNAIFSSIEFLGKALQFRPFDLAVNARATRLYSKNNAITGVEVMAPDKTSYRISAKNIVVSASALETPRLLLHSNIPGDAIGHYLTNHTISRTSAIISRTVFPELLGALGILIPSGPDRNYQIQIASNVWNQNKNALIEQELDIDLSAFGMVKSRFENKVTLDLYHKDKYGVPKINVQFSFSDYDQLVIHQMSTALMNVSTALGTKLTLKNGMFNLCLSPPGRPFHHSCTCRMGVDPLTSATDPYGRIHSTSGLYIADTSVLPTAGAVNPTLTTVALSIRTADAIAAQNSDYC